MSRIPQRLTPEYGPSPAVPRFSIPTGTVKVMIAFVVTVATLILVGAIVVSLERHKHLTPLTAAVAGLGTLAIVLGAIAATIGASEPATADVVPRGVTDNQLPERVIDLELPTL